MSQCCAVTDRKGRFFPLDMGAKGHTDLSRWILKTQNHQHMHRLHRCWGKKQSKSRQAQSLAKEGKSYWKQHNWKYRVKLSACWEKHTAPRCRATGETPDAWDRQAGDTAGIQAGVTFTFQTEDTKVTWFWPTNEKLLGLKKKNIRCYGLLQDCIGVIGLVGVRSSFLVRKGGMETKH